MPTLRPASGQAPKHAPPKQLAGRSSQTAYWPAGCRDSGSLLSFLPPLYIQMNHSLSFAALIGDNNSFAAAQFPVLRVSALRHWQLSDLQSDLHSLSQAQLSNRATSGFQRPSTLATVCGRRSRKRSTSYMLALSLSLSLRKQLACQQPVWPPDRKRWPATALEIMQIIKQLAKRMSQHKRSTLVGPLELEDSSLALAS